MRQRAEEPPRTLLQNILASIKGNVKQPGNNNPLPESLLVALGAIHHCDNRWVEDDAVFKYLESSMLEQLILSLRDEVSPETVAELMESIRLHKIKYAWPPSPEQRSHFLEMCNGIQTY
jgi:hypothetical protein